MSLNQILLVGNVGRDPEMRYTPSGAAVTDFRLAVNYRRNRQDGDVQDETEWFTVTAWNRLAETVNQYVVKGSKVFVDGRFRSRQYVGSDGQTRTSNRSDRKQGAVPRPAGSGVWRRTGRQLPGEVLPDAGAACRGRPRGRRGSALVTRYSSPLEDQIPVLEIPDKRLK